MSQEAGMFGGFRSRFFGSGAKTAEPTQPTRITPTEQAKITPQQPAKIVPTVDDYNKISLIPITSRVFIYHPSLTPSISIMASQALSTVSDTLLSTIFGSKEEPAPAKDENEDPDIELAPPIINVTLLASQVQYLQSVFNSVTPDNERDQCYSLENPKTRCLLVNCSENQPLFCPKYSIAQNKSFEISTIHPHSVIRVQSTNIPIYTIKTMMTLVQCITNFLATETGPIVFYPTNTPELIDISRIVMVLACALPFIRLCTTAPTLLAQALPAPSTPPSETETSAELPSTELKESQSDKNIAKIVDSTLKLKTSMDYYKWLVIKLSQQPQQLRHRTYTATQSNVSKQAQKGHPHILCPSQLRLLNYFSAAWQSRFPAITRQLSITTNKDENVEESTDLKQISQLYKKTSNAVVIDSVIVNGIPVLSDTRGKDCRPFLQVYQVVDADNIMTMPFLAQTPNTLCRVPNHDDMLHILGMAPTVSSQSPQCAENTQQPGEQDVSNLFSSSDSEKGDIAQSFEDNIEEGVVKNAVSTENAEPKQEKPSTGKLRVVHEITPPAQVLQTLPASKQEQAYLKSVIANEQIHTIPLYVDMLSSSIPLQQKQTNSREVSGKELDSIEIGAYTVTPKAQTPQANFMFIGDRSAAFRGTTTLPLIPASTLTDKDTEITTESTTKLSTDPTSHPQQIVWSKAQYDLIAKNIPSVHSTPANSKTVDEIYLEKPQKQVPEWIDAELCSIVFPLSLPTRGNFMLRLMHIQSSSERICLGRVMLFAGYLKTGLIRMRPTDVDDCHPAIQSIDIIIKPVNEPMDIESHGVKSIYHTDTWDNIGPVANQLDIGYLEQKQVQIMRTIHNAAKKMQKQHETQLALFRAAQAEQKRLEALRVKEEEEKRQRQVEELQKVQQQWKKTQTTVPVPPAIPVHASIQPKQSETIPQSQQQQGGFLSKTTSWFSRWSSAPVQEQTTQQATPKKEVEQLIADSSDDESVLAIVYNDVENTPAVGNDAETINLSSFENTPETENSNAGDVGDLMEMFLEDDVNTSALYSNILHVQAELEPTPAANADELLQQLQAELGDFDDIFGDEDFENAGVSVDDDDFDALLLADDDAVVATTPTTTDVLAKFIEVAPIAQDNDEDEESFSLFMETPLPQEVPTSTSKDDADPFTSFVDQLTTPSNSSEPSTAIDPFAAMSAEDDVTPELTEEPMSPAAEADAPKAKKTKTVIKKVVKKVRVKKEKTNDDSQQQEDDAEAPTE